MTAIPLKRVVQIPAFCGPATLAMLFSQYNLDVDQVQIASAGNALPTMEQSGMRLDQLALAVRTLAPHVKLWAKRNGTFQDIDMLVNTYHLAVGVEWQGLWLNDQPTDELMKDDPGHYSAILSIDLQKKELLMRDPSTDYKDHDRHFSCEQFEKLWFDVNEVGPDAPEEAKDWMDDYHVLFVLAPAEAPHLEALGLQKVRVPQTISQIADQKTQDPLQ